MLANPFQTILDEIGEVKQLLYSIQKEPDVELKKKFYTIKEAAEILKVDYQTIRSHIIKGNIKAELYANIPQNDIKNIYSKKRK